MTIEILLDDIRKKENCEVSMEILTSQFSLGYDKVWRYRCDNEGKKLK